MRAHAGMATALHALRAPGSSAVQSELEEYMAAGKRACWHDLVSKSCPSTSTYSRAGQDGASTPAHNRSLHYASKEAHALPGVGELV